MKKKRIIFILTVCLIGICSGCGTKKQADGEFEGESRGDYLSENYWGVSKIELEKGKLADIEFYIIDKNLDEIFGNEYEKHYEGNETYIRQCRNECAALPVYVKKLLDSGDINQVDAITGATWSYDLLKASYLAAMDKAGK